MGGRERGREGWKVDNSLGVQKVQIWHISICSLAFCGRTLKKHINTYIHIYHIDVKSFIRVP